MTEKIATDAKTFRALFIKYWSIIYILRVVGVWITSFSGTWLFAALLGPVGVLLIITSPEVDFVANLFGGLAVAYWPIVLISLLLMAITSAGLAAIIAASVVLTSRYFLRAKSMN